MKGGRERKREGERHEGGTGGRGGGGLGHVWRY